MHNVTTDLKHLMKLARKAGWTVEQIRSHSNPHWRWITPDGRMVLTTSHTPGSLNMGRIRTCLRREGVLR